MQRSKKNNRVEPDKIVYHYTLSYAIIHDYDTILPSIAIIAFILFQFCHKSKIIGIIEEEKHRFIIIFVHFSRWYNRNNREISDISEIKALTFHLLRLISRLFFSGVGPRALFGIVRIMHDYWSLCALRRLHSGAIIVSPQSCSAKTNNAYNRKLMRIIVQERSIRQLSSCLRAFQSMQMSRHSSSTLASHSSMIGSRIAGCIFPFSGCRRREIIGNNREKNRV